MSIAEHYVERRYIHSTTVDGVIGRRGDVFCKPWVAHDGKGKAYT